MDQVHDPDDVIAEAFTQAGNRDPGRHRPWLFLVDGARHQLDLIEAGATRRDVTVRILIDFVHETRRRPDRRATAP
uniref:hypothetical protein n=1 Tax=Streptomyces sp. SJL17-4 TaxID=2967224 RepID=UPI00403FF0B0